ncbi:MAG TPA: shikimate dehydrogenase [Tepidisphaeraceae bacterium]|jgi:3-dehydroquinate dehydratase/shikimate dehydrogenase
MTLLCVSIFVSDPAQMRRDALRAAEAGADLIELRMDRLHDAQEVVELGITELPLPAIVTCRPTWEGGEFAGSEEERLKLLRAASEAGAKFIDLELEAFKKSAMADAGIGSRLIVSSHDFSGRPERLYNVLAEMNRHHAGVAKMVWAARTVRDNLEAFEVLKVRQKPSIAFCMGEAGLISRVLAKKFGAFLSFASLQNGGETAPGQVSVEQMKNLYRWDALSLKTQVYGVIAEPVGHSMSPAIHNAAFSALKYDGVYLPFLVHAGYESFKAFMESFLHFDGLDLRGLSVTLPHKENALRYLIEKNADVEELARTIGAVNTIIIDKDGTLHGKSTDYAAILDSICAALGEAKYESLQGKKVAVIGAGGTGRTTVAALAHYGANVTVLNRTIARAEELAREFDGKTGTVEARQLEDADLSFADILINTTSVGMHPNIDAMPLENNFRPRQVVFDAIYNPIKTRWLAKAEEQGATIIGGVEMFVRQAAGQFQAWTQMDPPANLMRQIVIRRLGA